MTSTIPVSGKHPRVDAADALRGFAVLAIILLHSIEHFNYYSFPAADTMPDWLNFLNKAVWDGLFFAFGGKAYAIFALLFGFSFFVQNHNQRVRDNDFRLRFCWRLILLFIIGNFNAIFFTGEILVLYSLVGFVLVLTCRMSTRNLIILATILLLQPVCIYQAVRAALQPSYEIMSLDTSSFWAATFSVQSAGTFMETLKVNLWEGQLASLAWAWDNGRVFQTAGIFILGMLIGRQGWFLKHNLHNWGIVLAAALVAYFPLTGIDNLAPQFISNPNILTPLHIILSSLAKFSFMLILVSGLLFGFYCTNGVSKALKALIPYGRMSMTNYVTQGIIGAFLFYNWGLHLSMPAAVSVLVGVAIFAVQYAFCRFWVGRHNHGPLEYIWKRATWL